VYERKNSICLKVTQIIFRNSIREFFYVSISIFLILFKIKISIGKTRIGICIGFKVDMYMHIHSNRQFGRESEILPKFINIAHLLTPLSSPSVKMDAGESEGPLESYPGCRSYLIREPYERVVSRYVPPLRFPPSYSFRCVSSCTHSHVCARACIACTGERRKKGGGERERERERERGKSTDHHPDTGCISLYLWARW